MYPPWKSTFDAHIYEGRVLEVVLMQSTEEPLAKATIGVSLLAERCKKSKINGHAEFWVDLLPSGKVYMAVQFFLEDSDAGKTAWNYRPVTICTVRCVLLKGNNTFIFGDYFCLICSYLLFGDHMVVF